MKKLVYVLVLGLFLSSSVVVLAEELPIDTIGAPVEEVPLVCELPKILNDAGDDCFVPDPTPAPVQEVSHRKTGSYLPVVFERLQEELSLQNKVVYVWDVVKFGDKSQDVKDFQSYLNFKGANLKVDGIYGPLTLAAWNKIK